MHGEPRDPEARALTDAVDVDRDRQAARTSTSILGFAEPDGTTAARHVQPVSEHVAQVTKALWNILNGAAG